MRAHIVAALVICWLVRSLPTIAASELPSHSPGEKALRFIAALPMATIDAALHSLRPEPISGEQKQRALAMLPVEGVLVPTADEVTKLEALRRVLIYHKREDVFEVKVVDLPEAAVALYSRSIVLASRPALRLLSALEFQAIVAHEIGHEYFRERQRHLNDARARQELEFRCDAIAILTMLELDLDPSLVVSAALKMTRFNERLGMRFHLELYPTVPEREEFTRAILQLVCSRGLAASAAQCRM